MSSTPSETHTLLTCIIMTLLFMCIELIGGYLSGSLALISDAAHMLTDASALMISLIALILAKKPANTKQTFGYYRLEILAAILNTSLLFLVSGYIFFQAIYRYQHPEEIQPIMMTWIALLGFLVNFLIFKVLHSSKNKSLSFKSAYLEVLSDLFSSLGVIVGGLMIYFYHWKWIDSLIALFISIWILPRSWLILKESINILLESVPEHINIYQVKMALEHCQGVIHVHDLHIWSINQKKINLTAHVVIEKDRHISDMMLIIKEKLKKDFLILHSTIQFEYDICNESHQH